VGEASPTNRVDHGSPASAANSGRLLRDGVDEGERKFLILVKKEVREFLRDEGCARRKNFFPTS